MYHGRFKGSHYAAGFKYGSLLKKRGVILNNCSTFQIDHKRIKYGIACRNEINKYYPEVVEEIKGLAKGNGCDFDFLCAMILTMYSYDCNNHCSCFAYHDDNRTVFGRNSDFLVSIEKLYMNVIYSLDGVYSFTGNTTAFIEIEDGVNEYGFACGLTFIPVRKIGIGYNVGILIRYLLEKCKTVNDALEEINKLPIASGGTLTMADTSGNIATIELATKDINVIHPKNHNVFATNIFISDKMKKLNIQEFDNWKAETRYQTMKDFFNCYKPTIDSCKKLLGGEYGFMCQYDRKKNADTVWSVIYDLTEKRIYRVEGNPRRKSFKEDFRFMFK